MKKALILILSGCLVGFYSIAQQATLKDPASEKGYLSLSLGGAFPIGEFASKNAQDIKSGIADPGGLLDLSYMHPLRNSPFGWTATLRARFNPIDGKAEASAFAAEESGFNWSEKHVSWETGAVLLGAYYHCPVAGRWQFRASLLAGVADSRLPASSIIGVRNDNPPTELLQITTNKVSAVSFSALAKAGLVYFLNPRWSLIGELGFWYLKPTFKNVNQRIIDGKGLVVPGFISLSNATSVTISSYTNNYTHPMNTIDLSVGIAMRL